MRHFLALAAMVIPMASQAQADTGRLVGSQWMNGATIEVRRHGDDSVQVLARSIRGAAQATLSLTSAQLWVDSARALLRRDVPRPKPGGLTTLEVCTRAAHGAPRGDTTRGIPLSHVCHTER